jgi:predicted RNA-binding Zn ribbon-like protein
MVEPDQSLHKIPADHPFLAFVNSVDDDGKSRDINMFATGAELRALLAEAGVAVPAAAPDPAEMRALMQFREAAYAVLSARAAHRTPPRAESLVVEQAVKAALGDGSFGFGGPALQIAPDPAGGLLDRLALSLFDLTISPDFERLSECRRCTRLFIDRGRGRGRRWCDMARCGNRAKAESFRARKRSKKPA